MAVIVTEDFEDGAVGAPATFTGVVGIVVTSGSPIYVDDPVHGGTRAVGCVGGASFGQLTLVPWTSAGDPRPPKRWWTHGYSILHPTPPDANVTICTTWLSDDSVYQVNWGPGSVSSGPTVFSLSWEGPESSGIIYTDVLLPFDEWLRYEWERTATALILTVTDSDDNEVLAWSWPKSSPDALISSTHVFVRDGGFSGIYQYQDDVAWEYPGGVVRLYPRDDGLGMSSAPRMYPPTKAGRKFGGYR